MRFWAIFVNYYIITKNKYPITFNKPSITKLMWLRGFLGFAGGAFLVKGISMLPLSEAVVLVNMTPPIGGIIACLTLKEPLTKILIITSILSTIGVMFIAKPSYFFPTDAQ